MRYAIVPQAIRRVIPPLMNEFVILIKDTSLVVVLGLSADEYDIFSSARRAIGHVQRHASSRWPRSRTWSSRCR